MAEWFEILDAEAATRLSHDQIVGLLVDVYEAPEWGAQSVAVRYAQERGMRLPGQQPDGTFSVSASRSIPGSQSALLDVAIAQGAALTGLEPDAVHRLPERTTAEWTLANGELLVASVGQPASGQCAVSLVQSRIRLPELVARLRETLTTTVVRIARDAA
ncbi:hypothetical protein [Frondihabitans cladoniiphilus]|uniref:hypothetical protein n=1 Tax=Frondihabitans cladoniiphilus TaxID=715785 RepID=UPI0031EB8E7F